MRSIDGGEHVNALYMIAGLIAAGLLVYLVLAMLKPEWFG
jgi:K+-transporting ATPase KdpF subunit